MEITLDNVSKKYHREWIFKDLNTKLVSGNSYAITGPNGSGKSTLIQVISGALLPSSGSIRYQDRKVIPPDQIYKSISIASPYLELVEEFTLSEFLEFHFKFKQLKKGVSINELIELTYLEEAKNKYIRNFSSGMKQRLKLALCFFAETEIILFDEPTSNLDQQGIDWYKHHVQNTILNQLVLIASNQIEEYQHSNLKINISDYK